MSNQQLRDLFLQDQQFRTGDGLVELQKDGNLWSDIRDQDAKRRRLVSSMIEHGQLETAGDYWRASAIMQHGDTAADYKLAYQLAVKGVQLGQPPMNSIIARSVDRYLIQVQKDAGAPEHNITQFFGTNFQTERQRVISYVYPTHSQIDSQLLQFAGIIDIGPFLGQAVADYYKVREREIKSALSHWHTLSQKQQSNWIDQLVAISSKAITLQRPLP